jgi:protein TonB
VVASPQKEVEEKPAVEEGGNVSSQARFEPQAALSHSPPPPSTALSTPTKMEKPDRIEDAFPISDQNPQPVYPRQAIRRNYQGTVLLHVLVDEKGRPTKVELIQSSGFFLLDQSAMDSVRRWRFQPATRNGHPIAKWSKLPIIFELH